jgi:DNA-binding MarR family transcriptional regulator
VQPTYITVYSTNLINDGHAELSGFVVERTAKRMKQFFQEQMNAAGLDITIDQWVLLQQLDQADGRSQLELARATFKDAPTVTRIVDLLCRKGLTRRLTDPNDRRRFRVELTEQGREKIRQALPTIRAARVRAWQGLSQEEVDRLAHILNKVFDNLRPSEKEQAFTK